MTGKPFALIFSVLASGAAYARRRLRALRRLLHRGSLSVPLDMNAHSAATRGGWPFDLMAPDL